MSLPLPPPRLPPLPPPPPPAAKWAVDKLQFDRVYVSVTAVLTRTECFRLIGELERVAASA